MGERIVHESDYVVTLPAYFLVRTDEVNDAGEFVRHTLRLGGKGRDSARQWYIPIFSSESEAECLAIAVKRIDDKLRVIEIGTLRDFVTILEALLMHGDKYVALDPQSHRLEHFAISSLLSEARRQLPDYPEPARPTDPGPKGSWLRRRLAPSAHGRGRPEAPSTGSGAAAADTEAFNSQLTSRRIKTIPR